MKWARRCIFGLTRAFTRECRTADFTAEQARSSEREDALTSLKSTTAESGKNYLYVLNICVLKCHSSTGQRSKQLAAVKAVSSSSVSSTRAEAEMAKKWTER